MIAGLASQVVSLVLFMGLCGEFAYRVWKNPYRLSNGDARMREVRGGRLWRGFLGGMFIPFLLSPFLGLRMANVVVMIMDRPIPRNNNHLHPLRIQSRRVERWIS